MLHQGESIIMANKHESLCSAIIAGRVAFRMTGTLTFLNSYLNLEMTSPHA